MKSTLRNWFAVFFIAGWMAADIRAVPPPAVEPLVTIRVRHADAALPEVIKLMPNGSVDYFEPHGPTSLLIPATDNAQPILLQFLEAKGLAGQKVIEWKSTDAPAIAFRQLFPPRPARPPEVIQQMAAAADKDARLADKEVAVEADPEVARLQKFYPHGFNFVDTIREDGQIRWSSQQVVAGKVVAREWTVETLEMFQALVQAEKPDKRAAFEVHVRSVKWPGATERAAAILQWLRDQGYTKAGPISD